MVVDDGLVGGADVVAVLENALHDEPEGAEDAQPQGGFGQGLENAPDGLVHQLVNPLDEPVGGLVVVGAALVALGKRDIGVGNRLLQVLEQQVGERLGGIGQVDEAHHEGVLGRVGVDGLTDFGPVAFDDTMRHGGYAFLEHFARMFPEFAVRWQAVQGDAAQLHLAGCGVTGGEPPLAGVADGRCGGDFDHLVAVVRRLAHIADVQVAGKDGVHPGIDEAVAQLLRFADHVGCRQGFLHVEVGHQVVVHHGDDISAGGRCRCRLVNKPLLGGYLQRSACLAVVAGIASRDEGV